MAKTITRKEYDALTKEEKKNWVPLPSIESNAEVQASLAEAQVIAKASDMIKPVIDKTKFIPTDLPAEKLLAATNSLNDLLTVKNVIDKLKQVPIINQLAAPVTDALQNIIDLLGSIFYIVFAIANGQELFFQNVNKIIDDVQWEDFNLALEQIKKMREEARKLQEQKDNDAISKINQEINETYGKITTSMNEIKESVNKAYNALLLSQQFAEIQRKLSLSTYKQYDFNEWMKSAKDVFGAINVDLSPLAQPTDEQMAQFNKNFPDPMGDINKINNLLNKINNDVQYIHIDDLEQINKNVADSQKKSVEDLEQKKKEAKEDFKKKQEDANKEKQEAIDEAKVRQAQIKEYNKKSNTIK